MRDIDCLRCSTPMQFYSSENIQLGRTGWVLGDLPNLMAGAMRVDIFVCPKCGKVEFFLAEDMAELPQVTCPKCGTKHDFDYPKCPSCGHEY